MLTARSRFAPRERCALMKQKARAEKSNPRRGKVAAMIVILSLALGGVSIAGWSSLFSSKEQIAPMALTPSTPAKEYYYAGGKLVATEQTEASGGCSYSINPASQNFAASGGSGSFNVNTTAGCAWTAMSNASWINVTGGTPGSGPGTVSYSVGVNSTASSRSGTITAAGQTYTVTQDAASGGCTYSISPTSQSVGAGSGTGPTPISVTTQAGCAWSATSNVGWIHITAGASGIGNGSVSYSFDQNTGPARSGTMTIAGQTFTLNQSSGCSYSISPSSQSFASSGGTGSVSVTAGTGCGWGATSNAAWITITSGATGSGNGTVGFTVASNSSASRTGTMTIAGLTFTVTQSAGGGGCTYSISPTSKVFTSVGGVAAVNITAGAGCAWTSTSNATWITITSGATGSGNGQTKYQVAANSTGAQRVGTLTIAGKTHTVTQNP